LGRKKADGFCDLNITEVISLKSGFGCPWENFIPGGSYITSGVQTQGDF
jgi:hypothetical protein